MKVNGKKPVKTQTKPGAALIKPSKKQDYLKTTSKHNWSSTKSVYTRPR